MFDQYFHNFLDSLPRSSLMKRGISILTINQKNEKQKKTRLLFKISKQQKGASLIFLIPIQKQNTK